MIYGFTGGILIGLAAVGMLLTHGKIAGISGITKGLFSRLQPADRLWRVLFLLGLVSGGFVMVTFLPKNTAYQQTLPFLQMVIGGLFVGIGTSIGNGCTSGHGICGLGRGSKRSFISVFFFVLSALLTMYVITYLFHIPRL